MERERGTEAVQPVENLTNYQMEKFQATFEKFRMLVNHMEAAYTTIETANKEGVKILFPQDTNFDFAGFYNASMKQAGDIGNNPFSFGDLMIQMVAYNSYVQESLQDGRNTRTQQQIGNLTNQL